MYFLKRAKWQLTKFLSNSYYDFLYGIDTAQNAPSAQIKGAFAYEATDWFSLSQILRGLDIKPTDGFLDIGCGKGRVLLLATEFSFRQIRGVEISSSLCAIARKNIENYLSRTTRHLQCRDLAVIEANIADFEIPGDVTWIFLYNPFHGALFEAFIENLAQSVKKTPRSVYILYRLAVADCHKMLVARPEIQEAPGIPSNYQISYKLYQWAPQI